jgi:hypothetical protein
MTRASAQHVAGRTLTAIAVAVHFQDVDVVGQSIAYDACEKQTGRVSSQLLVRYRGTDYSVPTAYGHREVVIRGYVHEVVISCGATVIARHPRYYERDDFVFNPLHYLDEPDFLARQVAFSNRLFAEAASLIRLGRTRGGCPSLGTPAAANDGCASSRRSTGQQHQSPSGGDSGRAQQ